MSAYVQYDKELFESWSCHTLLTGLQGPDPSPIDHPWDKLIWWVYDRIFSQPPRFPNSKTSWLNDGIAFHKGGWSTTPGFF